MRVGLIKLCCSSIACFFPYEIPKYPFYKPGTVKIPGMPNHNPILTPCRYAPLSVFGEGLGVRTFSQELSRRTGPACFQH